MAKLRIAIVDDEPEARSHIRSLIESTDPHADVFDYPDSESFLRERIRFDLVYMDIRMHGTDGISAAQTLRKRGGRELIVFLTALRDYVFDALDTHPFHFLVKPVDREVFQRVYSEAADVLAKDARKSTAYVFVQTRKASTVILAEDLLYVESVGRKLFLHTLEQVYEMNGTLRQIEEQTGESFCRCHRAYLVNMDWICGYTSDQIELKNGDRVFLARKKHGEFTRRFMRHMERRHGVF